MHQLNRSENDYGPKNLLDSVPQVFSVDSTDVIKLNHSGLVGRDGFQEESIK